METMLSCPASAKAREKGTHSVEKMLDLHEMDSLSLRGVSPLGRE